MEKILSGKTIELFSEYLKYEEKSNNTVEKYVRDVKAFLNFIGSSSISKDKAIENKKFLIS